MNRNTILAVIDRQLRDSFAETGDVRPLGEIVFRVASEIRPKTEVGNHQAIVIPIEKVASFVDGHLDPFESQMICDAVMVDNSVLAELIAAVRARETSAEQLPPISSSLSARLNAMQSMIPGRQDGARVDANRESSQSPSDPPVIAPQTFGQPEIAVYRSVEPVNAGRRQGAGFLPIAAGLLAIAATIVVAVVLFARNRDRQSFDRPLVAGTRGSASEPILPPEWNPGPAIDPSSQVPNDATEAIVENKPAEPPTRTDPRVDASEPDRDVEMTSPPVTAVAKDDAPTRDAYEGTPESRPIPQPERGELSQQDPPTLMAPPESNGPIMRLADFKWTEISGLLTQRNTAPTKIGSQPGSVAWKAVHPGSLSSASSNDASTEGGVFIRTLPFSRAEAEFATGGRIVVSGDTGFSIDRHVADASAQFNLLHGSVAMMDIDPGTSVKLTVALQPIAMLRWQGQASAVVHCQADGVQIQVEGGPIEINDRVIREESVRVAESQAVETIRAPKRLPRWVSRPDETSVAERMILAQISNSDDVATALNKSIRSLASADRLSREQELALAKLANWHAAMAGTNLYRLASSRIPAMRLAGLQRMAQMPESDPRYQRTWKAIERAVNNQRRFFQIRTWFQMLRNGNRPNKAQTEMLIAGLSSRDFAGRTISDFILRQYVLNPPAFDPTWNGQVLQRAVNRYRDRAGLPMRPNGAAGGV